MASISIVIIAAVSTLLLLSAYTIAWPQFGQPGSGASMGGPPPPPQGAFLGEIKDSVQPGIPPELKAILPAEAVAKLEAIHVDNSIDFHEKQERIDKVMSNLPTDVLDRIPPPPGFDRLPEPTRNQLKSINRNPNKSWADKQRELHQFIQSLPQDQKAILMGGMRPGGGPAPAGGQ